MWLCRIWSRGLGMQKVLQCVFCVHNVLIFGYFDFLCRKFASVKQRVHICLGFFLLLLLLESDLCKREGHGWELLVTILTDFWQDSDRVFFNLKYYFFFLNYFDSLFDKTLTNCCQQIVIRWDQVNKMCPVSAWVTKMRLTLWLSWQIGTSWCQV
jgi:uncharacterized membrane protein